MALFTSNPQTHLHLQQPCVQNEHVLHTHTQEPITKNSIHKSIYRSQLADTKPTNLLV